MNLPEYEYKGLMAQAWDVLRGDTSNWEDRFFYLEAIQKYGQPVLDVGCGTGRILLDFLAQGIDIDGVDNSPDMLQLCSEKAEHLGLKPHLFEQYMEDLALRRQYQVILVPSSSLQLVIEPEMIDKVMQKLWQHLRPGGYLVAPLMTIWQVGDPLESEWEKEVTRPSDQLTFRRVSWARYYPEQEWEETRDLYQVLKEGQVIAEEQHQRSPATRSYNQRQARALFERNGFTEVQLYSHFTFEPARPGDQIFAVIGRKPPL